MKKLFSLICLLVLAAGSAFAQKMVVKTADGKAVKFNVTKVTEVTFEEAEPVEWVDLGLPSGTLWASCNIGANSPEEYGYYFAWGETEQKSDYTWSTYFDYDESSHRSTKYCNDGGLTELLPEDDAASTLWDVSCKMPSKAQFEELLNSNYTTQEWTQLDGVNGTRITSIKNGNSIFLPAAGFRNGTSLFSQGSDSYYWSRTLSESSSSFNYAECIYCFNQGSLTTLYSSRVLGFSVRPVREKEPVLVEQIVLNPSLSLELSYYYEFKPTVLPEDADNKTLEWESSNTSIATVNSNGRVKAIAEGTCKITCRATDGSGVYAECQVTAIANSVREYVDLGLPSGTLWATMNVGATSPEEQGDTFRWGETEPYDGGSPDTYKFYGNYYYSEAVGFEIGDLTKYCSDSSYGYKGFRDYQTVLELEDDAATMNWGSEWHMPSKAQVEELGNSAYTALSFTTQNGVNGVLITSKTNGNIIFLPAQRDYWTREKSNDLYREATKLTLNWNNQRYSTGSFTRTSAYSVRPVREKEREYVDLGLPSGTLWATMNVGAGAPEDYGDYFAWGEIEPKSDYSWETYKWCKGSEDELTKYCTRSDNDFKDDLTELEPKDDAATVNWGSEWQMPSRAQCDELKAHTTQEWTTLNGVQGCLLTAPNGNSIFFPAASYMRGTETEGSGYLLGKFCDYGSRSFDTYLDYKDAPLTFVHPSIGSEIQFYNYKERCYGKTVRPVRKN